MRLIVLCWLALWSFAGFSQSIDWEATGGPYGGIVNDVEYDAASGWTYALVNNNLYYSTNDAGAWTKSATFGFSAVDIEISGGTVYLLQGFDLYTSPAGQDNFAEVTTSGSLNAYKIKRMPNGNLVALGQFFLYVSTNNGVSFATGASISGAFVTSMLEVSSDNKVIVLNASSNVVQFTSTPTTGVVSNFVTSPAISGTVTSIATNNARTTLYIGTTTTLFETPATNGVNGTLTTIKGGSITAGTISSVTNKSLFELSVDGTQMFFIDNVNHAVHYKTVAGAASTWAKMTMFPGAAFSDPGYTIISAVAKNATNMILGTYTGFQKTTNNGGAFAASNGSITAVQPRTIAQFTGSTMYLNADQSGLFASFDQGETWDGEPEVQGSVAYYTSSRDYATNYLDAAFALGPANSSSTDLYRTMHDASVSFNQITPWALIPTPAEFEWVGLSDNNRAFGMGFTTPTNLFYYSNDYGANWSSAITIGGTWPSPIDVDPANVKLASSSLMFAYAENLSTFTYDYYRIAFTIGSGLTISGTATKLTLPFTNINKIEAKNGKFYIFDTSTTPDRFAVWNGVGTGIATDWTSRNVPVTTSTGFYVTDNGYIFIVDRFGSKIYLSRDDGATFIETNMPVSSINDEITDITFDQYGYAYLALYQNPVYKSRSVLAIPDAPSGLVSVATTSRSVALRWNDNSTSENYFTIERSTNGVDFQAITSVDADAMCTNPGSQGHYLDQNVTPGATYYYRIAAVNDAGTSSYATLGPVTMLATCTTTAIPDGRSWTATNVGGNPYGVTTVSNIGIRHISDNVYEVQNLSMSLTGSAVVGRFTLDCGLTVVTPGTLMPNGTGSWNGTNSIVVKWRRCSKLSEFEQITFTLQSVSAVPTTPVVQALIASNTSIDLSWTVGFNQKDFIIERSTTSSGGPYTQVGLQTYPTNTFTDNTVTAGNTYYYRVTARNHDATPGTSQSIAVSVAFDTPNFIIANNEVSQHNSTTMGAYWADFDNDGNDDLFTANASFLGGGLISHSIFRNLGNGSFQEILINWDVNAITFFNVIDYDGDGLTDIVAMFPESSVISIYKGNGDFTFTKRSNTQLGQLATHVDGEINNITWNDVNEDGLLDVLLLAETTSAAQLFLQGATHTFSKTSMGSGVNQLDQLITEFNSATWADYDNDGDSDLLISGTSGTYFYTNNAGVFTAASNLFSFIVPATQLVNVQTQTTAWADYNNDGYLDVYMITSPVALLFKNNAGASFTEQPASALSESAFSSNAVWADLNNDGLQDLFVPGLLSQAAKLYINNTIGSTPTFTKVSNEKINDNTITSFGAAVSDYDGDGFLDMAKGALLLTPQFTVESGYFYLYKNNHTSGNWIEVKLEGVTNNRMGVGAQVVVTAGAKTYTQQVIAPTGVGSQNSGFLHFGIGTSTSVTSIVVRWPSGLVQTFNGPSINTQHLINEDAGPPVATAFNPTLGATGVGINTAVEITFDETTVVNGTKNMVIKRVSDNVVIHTLGVGTAVKSANKYTFTLPSALQQGTAYAVSFDAGAFSDIYGNVYAGLPSAWQFTTSAGPQVTTLGPLNNAVNVPSNTTIGITFNVPTTAVAGKLLRIYRTSDLTTPLRQIDASNAMTNGNQQSFTITPNLPTETGITVMLEAGAFKDAGNAVSASAQWAFTTMPGPKVTTFLPADEATAVAANTKLELTFDQTVTAEPGKKIKLFIGSEANTVYNVDVSTGVISGNKVTFTVSPKLTAQTNYTVIVDTFAFKDATGNLFNGVRNTEWNFRTDSGPAVTAVSPGAGTSNISTTAPIEITFSRTLSAAVAGKHLQLFDGSTSVFNVDVSATGTISGTKYTAPAPAGQWPAGKTLSIQLDAGAFVDSGGNDSDGLPIGTYSFATEVGPLITSRKPDVGEVGVVPTTSIEITFDKNITAVAGKQIEIKDGSGFILTSNVSTLGTVTGTKYTYPAPAGGWPLDKVLTVTLESGAFVDIGSKPSQAITGSGWTFRTIATPDTTPPEITFTAVPTADKQALPASFAAKVSDLVGVTSTKMSIRGIGGSAFTDVSGTGPTGVDIYTFAVSASSFDAIGAQYYFTATDASGNTSRSPASGYYQTYLKYNAQTSTIPSGLIGSTWKVISIPFQLGTNNAVASVFDELTSKNYKKDWRMLTLSANPDRWTDYNTEGFTNIERGVGYMLNVKSAPGISIGNDLTAPDNRRDNLFKITLRAGWNLIGNPYLVSINWANVVSYNNLTGAATVFKKFAGTEWMDSGLLGPFEGGAVNIPAQVEITIPFEGQIANGGRTKEIVFHEGDWVLPITLQQNGIQNSSGGIGMHHESTRSFDVLDNFNGPKFIDFIEMNFEHPNDFPRKFSRDVVNNRDEYTWEYSIDASGDGMAQMTWDASVSLPATSELILWDPAVNVAINMQESGSYEFDPRISRRFKILFGRDARSRIKPDGGFLGDPYPNPTREISYIPYSLPEGNPQYGVKIEVFDILGQRVATIEDGERTPGLFRAAWIPQDTNSNGLYTVRMTVVTGVSQEVYSGKILLNK